MTWNYRIMKHTDLTGDWYGIHEVHYAKDRPHSFTEALLVIDDPKDDAIVKQIAAAFQRPVLNEDMTEIEVSAGPHA